MNEESRSAATKTRSRVIKIVVLLVVAAAFAVLYFQFGDQLRLTKLAERESQLRSYQQQHPWLMLGIAFVAYVVVTGLSLPGAAGMTLVYGWLFGFFEALVIVSFASTTGATLAFLLSRYLIGQTVQEKFGDRLASFNQALKREGAFYLFTLRLIPAVPFFVINIVMGLTPIRVWTFWWVSQIGMFAGTCVYVNAGAQFPSLEELARQGPAGILTWELAVSFVLLGIFPLVVRFIMKRLRPSTAAVLKEDATD